MGRAANSLILPVTLVVALAISGCGQMRPLGSEGYLIHHAVQPGETLYSIAWHYGYDHRQVAAWNDLDAPYTLSIGQELVIIPPKGYVGPLQRGTPPTGRNSGAPSRPKSVSPVETAKERTRVSHINWRWPTAGSVVTAFSAGNGKKGLDIEGSAGQPVMAAAGGDVVYSGDGLIGYGNLVIIKHDRYYLSAYAHNRKLLVKEGQKVRAGQQIAEMGQTSDLRSILHFEIRKNGKPVDPARYLPEER